MLKIVLTGALLFAAPLFSQVLEFRFTETQREIVQRMGPPKMTASVTADIESWQFEAEEIEEGEFSHYLLFAKKTGVLQGITRNYPAPRNVDALFPAAETVIVELAPNYRARARRMPDGAWLIAMASTKPGDLVSQVLLMKESVLKVLYPAFR